MIGFLKDSEKNKDNLAILVVVIFICSFLVNVQLSFSA